MNILKNLIEIFTPNSFEITDAFLQTTVYIDTLYKDIDLNELYNILSCFPKRDNVTLKYQFSYDETLVISNLDTNTENIKSKIADYSQIYLNDKISVIVDIKKSYQQGISVYSFDKFNEWLFSRDLFDVMKQFGEFFKYDNFLKFICFDLEGSLETNSIIFSSPETGLTIDNNNLVRKDIINNSQKICNFYNQSEYSIIPDDFNIVIARNIDSQVIEYYNKIKIILALIYISDFSNLKNELVELTIKGYRSCIYSISLKDYIYKEMQKTLYDIYNWIYFGGNIYDKAQLARNIITLHCKYSSILELDAKTLVSINTNYGLYLKENVNNYLNVKKEFMLFVQGNIQELNKAVNSFSSDLKKNFFAFFSFLATLIISSSFAQLKFQGIFTFEVTQITSFILVGSIIYWLISLCGIIYKYQNVKGDINSIKSNYTDILEESDLDAIICRDKTLDTNRKRLISNSIIISIVWILMIAILFLALDYISGLQKLLFFINLFS